MRKNTIKQVYFIVFFLIFNIVNGSISSRDLQQAKVHVTFVLINKLKSTYYAQ